MKPETGDGVEVKTRTRTVSWGRCDPKVKPEDSGNELVNKRN